MARRKIIWSHRAKIKRLEILEFFIERNKSKTYSKKLNSKINKSVKLLVKYPEMGINTDIENIRGLIIDHIVLFYEFDSPNLIIQYIWDSRQNPDDLKIA